jgi:hypothetical protein
MAVASYTLRNVRPVAWYAPAPSRAARVVPRVRYWVMLHVQSDPLPICTRPRVLIKGKRT